MRASDLRDMDCERAMLGAIMLDNEVADEASELLSPDDFSRDQYGVTFACMKRMAENRKPIDINTLAVALRECGDFERAGGMATLIDIDTATPASANWRVYAETVRNLGTRRRLVNAALVVVEAAGDLTKPLPDVIGHAEASIQHAGERVVAQDPIEPLSTKIHRAMKRLEVLYERKADVTGAPSGLAELDALTTGFHPEELTILAARPSIGKTAAVSAWALSMAAATKKPIVFFEQEMSEHQMISRMIAGESRVDGQRFRTGKFFESDWPKMARGAEGIYTRSIYLSNASNRTTAEMRAWCRRVKSRYGALGGIVTDYLQIMGAMNDGKANNREQDVSEFARGQKFLAKEFGCPVIALSQLNRGVEQRADKHPMLSDLRESGSIEQEADNVIFIYRDEFYDKDSPDKGLAEFDLVKARNGPTGRVTVAFDKEFVTFRDLPSERRGGF